MKKIYFLLTRTQTVPARVIRMVKGGVYSHVSLSLTPETDRFYSYARRKLHNFLVGGIKLEDIHKDIFALYPDSICALYEISVSDEAYYRMKNEVDKYFANYKHATYNFLGTLLLTVGIKYNRGYKLTCSQFVAVMLHASGEIELPKDPYLMIPNDFLSIPGSRVIYEGALKDCHFPDAEPQCSKN